MTAHPPTLAARLAPLALALTFTAAAAATAGCGRDAGTGARPAVTEVAATAPAAPAPAAPPTPQQASVDTLDRLAAEDETTAAAMRTIAGRLQHEATHRPTGTVRAEAVLDALATAGLPLAEPPRQYVGVAVGAAYCAGGQTADGLAVAVCEYPSAAAAAAGKTLVEQRFAALTPYRDIVVHGATTLTLTATPDAPLAERKRAATAAFRTL